MKKVALPLVVGFGVSLLAISTATARQNQQKEKEEPQALRLYQQCQNQLKRDVKKEAEKLCEDGMKLYREGKQEEGVRKIQEGLQKFY